MLGAMRDYYFPTSLEGVAMYLAVAAAVIAVAGVLYGFQKRWEAKQRAALNALAERLHWHPEPGDTAEAAFVHLHQGWLVWLGMRSNAMRGRMVCLRPTLHLDLGLELPRHFELIPRRWEWTRTQAEQHRYFKSGRAELDVHFVFLCDRAEQPRAQELLCEPDVRRALLALSVSAHEFVRIEKGRVNLIFETLPDDAALGTRLEELTAVATALRQALAPARDEVRRGA